jgi:hypothetical protein
MLKQGRRARSEDWLMRKYHVLVAGILSVHDLARS